jgi:hypothetical protein
LFPPLGKSTEKLKGEVVALRRGGDGGVELLLLISGRLMVLGGEVVLGVVDIHVPQRKKGLQAQSIEIAKCCLKV